MTLPKYVQRYFSEGDRNFIRSTIQKVHHLANTNIPQEIYLPEETKIIDHLLDHSTCLVACFPEDPDTILGYILYDKSELGLVVHWYHIKSPYREKDILLKELLNYIKNDWDQDLIMTTHNSPNKQPDNFIFNQYLLRKYL